MSAHHCKPFSLILIHIITKLLAGKRILRLILLVLRLGASRAPDTVSNGTPLAAGLVFGSKSGGDGLV
jgi:hypothetical protein